MHINCKKTLGLFGKEPLVPLTVASMTVERQCTKLLGVTANSAVVWDVNVAAIKSKAAKLSCILRSTYFTCMNVCMFV